MFDLEYVDQCLYCGCSEWVHLYDSLEDITYRCAPGSYSFRQCDRCHAGILNPRPTAATITAAYANYHTHSPPAKAKVPHGGFALIKHMLANGYREQRFGLTGAPSLAIGSLLLKALPMQRTIIDSHYRFLPKTPGRLLDFGCGNGQFLMIDERLGWAAIGIDFDQAAVAGARSRGLNVHFGGQEVLDEFSEAFNAITATHVIEHLHDPLGWLQSAFRALKRGGFLYIECPNFSSYCRQSFGGHWRGLEVPRHIGIPSPESLRIALVEAGFTAVKVYPRLDVLTPIYKRSAALADGKNSEDESALDRPGPPRAALSAVREFSDLSEYLSVTSVKPA